MQNFIKTCKLAAILCCGIVIIIGGMLLALAILAAPFVVADQLVENGYSTWQPIAAILSMIFVYLYVATICGLFEDLHI